MYKLIYCITEIYAYVRDSHRYLNLAFFFRISLGELMNQYPGQIIPDPTNSQVSYVVSNFNAQH
jgi:hypothetical protein